MCPPSLLMTLPRGSALGAVEFGPQIKALRFSPRPHMVAQGLCIVHVHSFSNPNSDVNSAGPKVMKGVRNEPFVVHPRDVGILIFKGHRYNGKTFFRAGVKHAGTVFKQLGSLVRRALWENHDAHPFLQTLPNSCACGSAAVLALSVDPNRAEQRGSPSNDGPRFGFDSSDIHDGEAHWKQHGIHVGPMVAHQDRGLVGELSFPGHMQSHDALHPSHKSHKALVNPMSGVVLCCTGDAQPAQTEKHPDNGCQGQKQKQKNADEGSNGAHGWRVVPKVRMGQGSVGAEQLEPRRSGHAFTLEVARDSALHLFCGRSDNVHGFIGDGVPKGQTSASQMQTMSCVAWERPIHLISDDGVPNRGHAANLVGSPVRNCHSTMACPCSHERWPRTFEFW